VPALLSLAASEERTEVLDALALALGRCARGRDDEAALTALRSLARHEVDSVRAAAALGLGLTRSARAVDPLREALGDPSLDVASFAALGLGLLDEPRGVHALLSVASDTEARRDVRVCALRGLGLLDPDSAHAELARVALRPLVDEETLGPVLRAHAALSVGRLGGAEGTARLTACVGDHREHELVRSSAALGLGAGADPGDARTVELLARLARREPEAVVRQRVLVALGELGRRDRGGADTAGQHGHVMGALTRELRRGARSGDRPWAALGAALATSGHPGAHALVRERLLDAHERAREPGERAALGLALGLTRVDAAAPHLLAAFRTAGYDGERGYAAVALGLLQHRPAAPWLRQLLRVPDARALVRLRCATGLALLGDRAAVPALLRLLESPVPGAAESAASALGLLGDGAAVGPLLALVGHPLPGDEATDARGDVPGAATAGTDVEPTEEQSTAHEQAATRRRAYAVVALGLLGERGLFPGQPSALAELRAHVDPRAQVPALLAAWSVL